MDAKKHPTAPTNTIPNLHNSLHLQRKKQHGREKRHGRSGRQPASKKRRTLCK
jgi:hypothetical protein